MRKHYTSTSNCYKDIYASREYFYSTLRDLRLDFCDLFAYEAMEREKKGQKSVVFTLTYNDEHIHNFYGLNVLDSDDLHKRLSKASAFAKRLRRYYALEFDYIVVGEYGNGGASHNYVGKRGAGQNPHYHCVGWFAPIDGLVPKFKCPSYERLCLLLREAWQGCEEDNPSIYGRSADMRSKGLGFVRLQGEIISPSKGCNYIAKYMGKDMMSLHRVAFDDIMPTRFKCIALDYLKEHFFDIDVVTVKELDMIFHKWLSWLPINHRLYNVYAQMPEIRLSDEILRLMPTISEKLDELFSIFLDDFTQDFNRISPKLRHFKGFGMSILDNVKDTDKGLYQRPLSNKLRRLPASARRKLYYDYSVSLVPAQVSNIEEKAVIEYGFRVKKERRYVKSVTYTLNELGRRALRKQTTSALLLRHLQLKSIGKSSREYELANILYMFRHTMLSDSVCEELFAHIDSGCLVVDNYVDIYLSTINLSAPDWFREENHSILHSFDRILALDYPMVSKAIQDIDNWYSSLRDKKDIDDGIFCKAWETIYKSTY